VAPSSERFWHEAYALRRGADGSVACPDSLRCLATDVLSAGKAAVLMRHSQASGARHALRPRHHNCSQNAVSSACNIVSQKPTRLCCCSTLSLKCGVASTGHRILHLRGSQQRQSRDLEHLLTSSSGSVTLSTMPTRVQHSRSALPICRRHLVAMTGGPWRTTHLHQGPRGISRSLSGCWWPAPAARPQQEETPGAAPTRMDMAKELLCSLSYRLRQQLTRQREWRTPSERQVME